MASRTSKLVYMILILEERNGEYEYCHKSVHELSDSRKTTMKKHSEKYLKGFYSGKAEKGDDGYYFYGGEVYVRISWHGIISNEEYNVLSRYL